MFLISQTINSNLMNFDNPLLYFDQFVKPISSCANYFRKGKGVVKDLISKIDFIDLGKNALSGLKDNLLLNSAEMVINVAQVALVLPYVEPKSISLFTSLPYRVVKSNFLTRTYASITCSFISTAASKFTLENSLSKKLGIGAEKMIRAAEPIVSAFKLGCLHNHTINTLLHEYGHLLAVKYFDLSIVTSIVLHDDGAYMRSKLWTTWRHVAQYYLNTHSCLLHKTAIAAAGPAAAIAEATGLLILSYTLKNLSPKVSLYMKMAAAIAVINHVGYAYTAYLPNQGPGHDFVSIWKNGGISPAVSIAAMLAVPIFTQLSLSLGSYLINRKTTEATGHLFFS